MKLRGVSTQKGKEDEGLTGELAEGDRHGEARCFAWHPSGKARDLRYSEKGEAAGGLNTGAGASQSSAFGAVWSYPPLAPWGISSLWSFGDSRGGEEHGRVRD